MTVLYCQARIKNNVFWDFCWSNTLAISIVKAPSKGLLFIKSLHAMSYSWDSQPSEIKTLSLLQNNEVHEHRVASFISLLQMSASKLQMCREGNHARISIKKKKSTTLKKKERYYRNILNLKLQHIHVFFKISVVQLGIKNILWISERILPQQNILLLFPVPILLELWTREFLLHQIWSCITISGTFTLFLLWPCLHRTFKLPASQTSSSTNIDLCLITAKCFSFCGSSVLIWCLG